MKRLLSVFALAAPIMLCAQVLNKPKLALRNWATGFQEPTVIANCGDDRLFVVEKAGIINIVSDSMTVNPVPFLDITDRVNSSQNEQGLLGLAFEPNYLDSGYFYVYYTHGDPYFDRMSRFKVTDDPNVADPNSEQVLLDYPDPYWNHNGGDLHFGADGYLYVGFGDGGSGNDPQNHGQDYTEPLGDMFRIDVSVHNDTYQIPPTNPFAYEDGQDTLPELWAVGLRNPWRYSFDRLTGDLWIGDVGQDNWEEVDHWPAGDNTCPNFGWRCREGLVATPGVSQSGCHSASYYESPLAVFSHGNQGWCSVIGGYVYRGPWYPHHYGHYIFTDYCAGDFLTFSDDTYSDLDTMMMGSVGGYAAMGEDASGQLYVANQQNGQIKKIYDPCPMDAPTATADGSVLTSSAANTYQWYYNGVAINGATSSSYTATLDGFYWVLAGFGNNCSLRSDTLTMVTEGIADLGASHLTLYPVPASDRIVLERAGVPSTRTEVTIVDALGREVLRSTWPANETRYWVDVKSLSDGTFTVLCRDQVSGEVMTTRLVVQR